MADNIDVTPGSGKTVATDEIGGKQHQRVRPSQCVTSEDITEKAHVFFTSSYLALSLPNIATSIEVYIWNDTNGNLYFNWDNGANAEIIVAAKSARVIPVKSGATELYSKFATDPDSGTCYFEVRK